MVCAEGREWGGRRRHGGGRGSEGGREERGGRRGGGGRSARPPGFPLPRGGVRGRDAVLPAPCGAGVPLRAARAALREMAVFIFSSCVCAARGSRRRRPGV